MTTTMSSSASEPTLSSSIIQTLLETSGNCSSSTTDTAMTKQKEVKQLAWSFGLEEFQQLTSGQDVIGTTIVDGEEIQMVISLRDIGWDMMRSAINQNETLSKYPKIHKE